MSDNIKVVVKVRPLISREIDGKAFCQWRVKNDSLYQIDEHGKDVGPCYSFDKVYGVETKTPDVFKDVAKPIVEAATAGFNGTIFAYGQTSSGKTYTMSGTEDSPGIIPLAVYNLYEIIKNIPDRDFLVRVSYIEIYNEALKDLLTTEKKNVKVYETFEGEVKMDASEHVTASPEDVLRYLKEGEANRQTGATNMNEISSRSHSIFQITIESREHVEGEAEPSGCVNVSQLNLVDLAGSERAGQTGATGIRFKEGTHINKSLSSLALVIKQLSEDPNKFINYRDSKLTRILQNSLGGNAKTSIICAVTPVAVEETISTLQFANRAKAIKNKPAVNAVATDATMIQSLTKQLSRLQAQLETKRNLEVMLETKRHVEVNLKNQILALQKLILNGFGQRSSAALARRRAPAAPRRVTISTLHAIEEDAPAAPKFCTPSLKYNSMLVPGAPDFVPIQDESKLSTVAEEPRLVTPPPNEKKVNFSDEVIDLNSDDETLDVSCSPYHKCYASSKTPPCVLRKKAKIAEKDLKDIVELTEREKIYMPAVEELMKKLEHNSTVITKLEEDVNSLNEISKQKDLEIDKLKVKISKSEEEIKAMASNKVDMEKLCKDYTTKLTDWEVSYETLKQKSHRREQELLSLLDEQQKVNKKIEGVAGTTLSRTIDKELSHFLDMSRDISLVNSDNESSTANANDDEGASQIQDLVSEMQTQLSMKTRTVLELESNLSEHYKKIESLELSHKELQEMLNRFKEKLSQSENENHLLKSTIDTLKSTVSNQKSNLETAYADMDSYNSLIQELNIKLRQKENPTDFNINDRILEKMIQNEEQFIANNENIKNIIHTFKIALDSRNKEIDTLKLNQSDKSESKLNEELDNKEKQINYLRDEVQKLKDEIMDNITIIDNLKSENKILLASEHQLSEKLQALEELQHKMEQKNNESSNLLLRLQATNDELAQTVCEQNQKEHELITLNDNLNVQKETLEKRIHDLETDMKEKNILIESLKNDDCDLQENMCKGKEAISKLQKILGDLTGNIQEMPEIVDNFVVIVNILNNNINKLETTVVDIITQKKSETEISKLLRDELAHLKDKYDHETKDLLSHIESLNSQSSNFVLQNDNLQKLLNQVSQELEMSRKELSIINEQYNDLHSKAHDYSQQINAKDDIIVSLQEKLSSVNEDISKLQQDKQCIDNIILNKDSLIEDLESKLKGVQMSLEEKNVELVQMTRELNDSCVKRDQLLHEVLEKTTKLTKTCNLQTNSSQLSVDNNNMHNQITAALDSLLSYLSAMNTETTSEICNLNKFLAEAKQDIALLTQQNVSLKENVFLLETKNETLKAELEVIRTNYNNLQRDLMQGNKLIDSLQNELKNKLIEIEENKSKVLEFKEKVEFLDMSTKQKIEALQKENEQLKLKCQSLETRQSNIDNSDYEDEVSNPSNTSRISLCNVTESNKCKPPSLVTICCKRLEECILPTDKSLTSSNSEASMTSIDKATQTLICHCERLLSELTTTKQCNVELQQRIEQLLIEREEVRKEVQLLLEPANELQKRIVNHRTNLSTLTATTYAENKSLKSQVTALQHHHTRFHMLCQRDIPAVKKQLSELMAVLKKDSSFLDKANISFKRFSLPDTLDNNTTISSFRNDETTLDGDLLMLDTNLTLATSADNTLLGHDQTCLDVSQAFVYNEVACQTTDLTESSELFAFDSGMKVLYSDNIIINQKLESLKEENMKLREQVDNHTKLKELKLNEQQKYTNINCQRCKIYEHEQKQLRDNHRALNKKLISLDQELANLKSEKETIENKHQNLLLEIPSTDALVRKLNKLENEKNHEIGKLMHTLDIKSEEIKRLQEENDTLSTQVMENIDEADDLNKQVQTLTNSKTELMKKCTELENIIEEKYKMVNNLLCSQCNKNDMTGSFVLDDTSQRHSKFNRSLSESDTSSRINKICTLQNQLHASKQDCKELTEDVTTIKNHLERSNLSIGQNMDLDDSMGESNVFTFSKDLHGAVSLNMPKIPEENVSDVYIKDRKDCINYYLEVTGTDKENISGDLKIIDVMKMFYTNFVTKHNNEVENLINKMKCYEESRKELEFHVENLKTEYSRITEEFNEKDKSFQAAANILTQIKESMSIIKEDIIKFTDNGNNTAAVVTFKENLLKVIDSGLNLSSANVFEKLIDSIIRKHENDLSEIMNRYMKLQEQLENVTSELNIVNVSLIEMKSQLTDKENEYNLLKAQKEKVHEISNAVTLDIVNKERELSETIRKGCQKLVESDIMSMEGIDWSLPINNNIVVLFDRFVNQYKLKSSDSENLLLEINKSTTLLQSKEIELESVKVQNEHLQNINTNLKIDLDDKMNTIEKQKMLYEDLNKLYEVKVQENEVNVTLVTKISKFMDILKGELQTKQDTIDNITTELNKHLQNNVVEKDGKIEELLNTITVLEKDVTDLKTTNKIIMKEKEATAAELAKCNEIIKINKSELEKMTSDILVLRESVKDNISVIDSLKVEAKSLLEQNLHLKQQFEDKCRELLRLETNIKTHEKTAEIQSKMIMRLQKQKEDCENSIKEKDSKIEELAAKFTLLQKENEEIDLLKNAKKCAEARISELESEIEGLKRHTPNESVMEATRRRRQSLYDSQRAFSENKLDSGDHSKIEAVFDSRGKPDDLFMDVDDDSSNRSTPLRLSRGRDTLLSRNDQSEKEEDSRPSSVQAARRRRQSSHDLRRAVPAPASPHSEVSALRAELSELTQRYAELDEECETCALYLRERDAQCAQLKRDKAVLEKVIAELREKLKNINPNQSGLDSKKTFVDAFVNTDEDWANLHSVVVDRMSYDAEVEKNKRLTKLIEELRIKKQELKNTLAKMQKLMEKNFAKDNRELEATKSELEICRQELEELRARYKELDEECETCSQYLRERDEQCRKLKEAKAALESKLQQYQAEGSALAARRRRQSLHDHNRHEGTDTSDDLLSYQVERDDDRQAEQSQREIKLKLIIDKLSQQKAALEHQVLTMSASHPMYVATGSAIVQNQQLTDVMKENQKLKKINAKLVNICKKRGKDSRANEDSEQRG